MTAGALFGLAGVLVALFAVSPSLDPELVTIRFARDNTSVIDQDVSADGYTRTTEWFDCHGEHCHGWLYTPSKAPEGQQAPPVVIMGHGLGAQKDMGLDKYAEAFADIGLATLVIDYRHFGGSDGEPRHIVDPARHLEDYEAAVKHVQESGLGGRVDAQRMALWGSSFSGGHVLLAAAKLQHNVTCVISQIPALDMWDAAKRRFGTYSWLHYLRMTHAVTKDLCRRLMGLSPAYVKLVGAPGDLALLQTSKDQADIFLARKAAGPMLGGWQNLVAARVGLTLTNYRPIQAVPQISVPILFVGAAKDRLCPLDLVEKAYRLAPKAELEVHDCSHMEIYHQPYLGPAITQMQAFLKTHVLSTSPAQG